MMASSRCKYLGRSMRKNAEESGWLQALGHAEESQRTGQNVELMEAESILPCWI